MEFMPEVETERPVLTFISDLIPHMKCLNYLYIDDDGFDDEELVIFKMEVDEWVKLHRPGFVLEMRNSDACRSLSWESKEIFF
jgi:hypothetical protein